LENEMNLSTTASALEREIESLKSQLHQLSGAPAPDSDEAIHAHFAAIDKQNAERKAAAEAAQQRVRDQQQRNAESWLVACGVPLDADAGLKTIAGSWMPLTRHPGLIAGGALAAVAVAAAGNESQNNPGIRQLAAAWPKLPPAVRSALVNAAVSIAQLAVSTENA
jgi:hypothetical protein